MPDTRLWHSAAESIARLLARDAHRYAGEATWMGTTQDEDAGTGEHEFTYATLGPALYRGTSGVALFLAEAAAPFDNAPLRLLSLESMRHAVARAALMPAAERMGFYSGAIGVAWAAARAAHLLGEEELLDGARRLVRELPLDDPEMPLDIIDGAAGAAPALLRLADTLDSSALRDAALTLGERLRARAHTHSDGSWSWGDPLSAENAAPHLTGFAHGAAGIAWSLLRLTSATGDARFADGAWRAFAFENARFVADAANWPDLRESEDGDDAVTCGAAWCHGGPGIGLSRARAMHLRSDVADRRDTEAALRVTMRQLAAVASDVEFDGTLCHGRAGLIELACTLADALGDAEAMATALAEACRAAERHAHDPARWPVSVLRGSDPSLMVGLAGIGHAYLRLADPSVPSVLEPGG